MSAAAANEGKLLTLHVFISLVGPNKIKGFSVPARLKAYNAAYIAYREKDDGKDRLKFPLVQSTQGWLESFEAYERLVHLAGKLSERGVRLDDTDLGAFVPNPEVAEPGDPEKS